MKELTTIAITRENAVLFRNMGRSGESANEVFTRLLKNANKTIPMKLEEVTAQNGEEAKITKSNH